MLAKRLTWVAAWCVGLMTAVGVCGVAHGQLVINEVDYDQIGTDNNEFVELRNNFGCTVDLANLAVAFVNGANNLEYLRVSLAPLGTVAPGQYIVICNASVMTPPTALRLQFVAASNNIQNGSPDAIALIDTSTLTVLDSISYEGAMTAATITGFPGTVNLVGGTALPASVADSNTAPASLVRFPDGADTNNDAADWRLVSLPTPGLPNVDESGNLGPVHALSSCCGPADFDGDGAVGVSDIFAFLAAWFDGDPRANFNHVGGIDIQDIFDFLATWFLGCH